jgi:miniconductance mechanosensitive channel
MNIENILIWVESNPTISFLLLIPISILIFLVSRGFIGRSLTYFSEKTETKIDDILVEKLRPYRIAYIPPILLFQFFAYLIPSLAIQIVLLSQFSILWILILTITSLLDALNNIYESNENYHGVSIQGYIDLIKLAIYLVALILTISLFSGESPITLLSGLGALTAILLLIFKETILSLVASIQITSNDLFREGDWIEVPSYNADGDVIHIGLHTVKIQNFDKTISIIPTHKFTEVAFRNWRGMQESGGRRIKRAINVDLKTIRFYSEQDLDNLNHIQLLQPYLKEKSISFATYNNKDSIDSSNLINGRQLTNIGTYRAYIEAYLKSRDEIYKDGMTFLVRQLSPTTVGLPLEVYVFTKTVNWLEYEKIQSDIFDHLLTVIKEFDLKVYQILN